ncbi:uncharacterized protein EDB91DRAFT_1076284 [Suillus paluster]|uniref:uncharacterized protein n=1 Tax=Suillus paluster TaxID=48578 RepID=UPI001B875D2A|nr:uncharacterized protein EDB91DRAFT_1076284 [Suillus paluster]KAG1756182.1 hypothetical protein EDB91DRAFT_1076284 [Suillus paluster]
MGLRSKASKTAVPKVCAADANMMTPGAHALHWAQEHATLGTTIVKRPGQVASGSRSITSPASLGKKAMWGPLSKCPASLTTSDRSTSDKPAMSSMPSKVSSRPEGTLALGPMIGRYVPGPNDPCTDCEKKEVMCETWYRVKGDALASWSREARTLMDTNTDINEDSIKVSLAGCLKSTLKGTPSGIDHINCPASTSCIPVMSHVLMPALPARSSTVTSNPGLAPPAPPQTELLALQARIITLEARVQDQGGQIDTLLWLHEGLCRQVAAWFPSFPLVDIEEVLVKIEPSPMIAGPSSPRPHALKPLSLPPPPLEAPPPLPMESQATGALQSLGQYDDDNIEMDGVVNPPVTMVDEIDAPLLTPLLTPVDEIVATPEV